MMDTRATDRAIAERLGWRFIPSPKYGGGFLEVFRPDGRQVMFADNGHLSKLIYHTLNTDEIPHYTTDIKTALTLIDGFDYEHRVEWNGFFTLHTVDLTRNCKFKRFVYRSESKKATTDYARAICEAWIAYVQAYQHPALVGGNGGA